MYDKPKCLSQLLLFANPPKLDELCAVTVKLSKQLIQSSSAQPQILKCREIIFTEPTIIATPAYDINNAFHIVMEQILYKTGRLQARFQKIGLEASKPTLVTPTMYQACLRYTLVARIAPNWNKTGEWLIQGRDFLTSSGYVNAIKPEITVNHGEMFFSLDAATVKFQPLQVEDLDIYGKCYEEFMQNDHAEIDESAVGSPWCHVLPSMKKGKVVGVTRTLSQNGPFKSYKDLKRHWKNTYGYRLPESENGVIYYQVHFRPLGGRIFTYPEVCLRASDIQRVPRVDPKPILTAFLQDVQAKMTSICGMPLQLQTKVRFPVLELSQPSNIQQPNLTNKSTSGKVIYRSKEDMETLLNRPQAYRSQQPPHASQDPRSRPPLSASQNPRSQQPICASQDPRSRPPPSASQNPRSQPPLCASQNPRSQQLTSASQDQRTLHDGVLQCTGHVSGEKRMTMVEHSVTPRAGYKGDAGSVHGFTWDSVTSQKVKPNIHQHTAQSTAVQDTTRQNPTLSARIVPCFTARKPNSEMSKLTGAVALNTSRAVPVFKAKKQNTSGSTSTRELGTSVSTDNRLSEHLPNGSGGGEPTGQTIYGVSGFTLSQKSEVRSLAPTFKSKFPPGNMLSAISAKTLPMCTGSGTFGHNSVLTSATSVNVGVRPVLGTPAPTTPQVLGFHIPSTPKGAQMIPKGTPKLTPKTTPKGTQQGTPRRIPQGTPNMAKKRPQQLQDEEGTPKPKKPRAKPQIQESLDVEQLASANQLQKVNAPTLVAWLKGKGMACKSNCKKTELIDRVNAVLGLTAEP